MIHFLIDSTFGITDEWAKANEVEIVDLKLILDGITTNEGRLPEYEEFYTRLKNSTSMPTTSQPSPQDFFDKIDGIYQKDKDAEIIIITIASALSGTFNGAHLVLEHYKNKKIAIIDSQTASVGCRILLEELVELRDRGENFEYIVEKSNEIIAKIELQFIPETLEYLKRGGRVGNLAATIANLLKIKPIFNFSRNKSTIPKKAIGLNKAISDMISAIPKKLNKLYICYIHDKINVPKLMSKIKDKLGLDNVEAVPVSPVFGSHVGIGAFGVAALSY